MSHTALLPLSYSTVLCFTGEKHNKLVIAWTVCAVHALNKHCMNVGHWDI